MCFVEVFEGFLEGGLGSRFVGESGWSMMKVLVVVVDGFRKEEE